MRRLFLVVFALLVSGADGLAAQQTEFFACYVPDIGALYLIKRSGTPPACVASAHVEVSWTEGGALQGPLDSLTVTGRVSLAGKLSLDASGSLLVTGTPFSGGELPAGGAGTRFLWWPDRAALRAGTVTGTQWGINTIGENTAAFGKDTRASGGQAFAAGSETVASGYNSTAIGYLTTASGGSSFAAGSGSTATHEGSIALGGAPLADHDFATAIGYQVKALAPFSLAMGTGSQASAMHAIAIGAGAVASGHESVALGSNTKSSGLRSFAAGYASEAMGDVSFAWGEQPQVDASASHAFAAGTRAITLYPGTFTWADHVNESGFNAIIANEFAVRATGGVRFVTAVNGATPTAGVQLPAGSGTWSSLSDRDAKTDIAGVDHAALLERVGELPISTWRYRTQDGVRHIGPMAQDFYAAFGVGEDERHISGVDADGVALAAVQALLHQLRAAEARIAELERRHTDTRSR